MVADELRTVRVKCFFYLLFKPSFFKPGFFFSLKCIKSIDNIDMGLFRLVVFRWRLFERRIYIHVDISPVFVGDFWFSKWILIEYLFIVCPFSFLSVLEKLCWNLYLHLRHVVNQYMFLDFFLFLMFWIRLVEFVNFVKESTLNANRLNFLRSCSHLNKIK